MSRLNTESGFTLVEIIVSIVLLGIMVAVAGMGIVSGTKGYIFANENAAVTQKGQLAMARLSRELMALNNISNATSTAIVYNRPGGQFAFAQVGDEIKIISGSTLPDALNGDVLINNVNSFTLSYFKGSQPWQTGTDDIQLLSAITLTLDLNRSASGMGTESFSTTITPRNNDNYGGAPSTADPPTKSNYCFIATARSSAEITEQAVSPAFFWFLPAIIVGLAITVRHAQARTSPVSSSFSLLKRLRLSFKRRGRKGSSDEVSSQQGSALVGLIATLVIFAALGAVMLPLTTTSTFNQVGANSAARAYYLAESGYRYAASVYLNAGSASARDAALEGLHNQTFILANNEGQFHLDVYAHWYTVTLNPVGSSDEDLLETKVLGGVPPDISFNGSGRLRIGSSIYEYGRGTVNGSTVTFEKANGNWPSISVGTRVLPLCLSDHDQTVTQGGDLDFRPDTGAQAFPLNNGLIRVNGNVYRYKQRDLTGRALKGITDPEDPNMPAFTLVHDSEVHLEKTLSLHSIGTFGKGGPMETRREIVFNGSVGIGESLGTKETYYDTFEDKNNWQPSAFGDHDIQAVDGNNALEVRGTLHIGGSQRASLLALNWRPDFADLENSWQHAGNLLSYDTQIKVRAAQLNSYMAGINLRMDLQDAGNDIADLVTLGVSFLKGASSGNDRIPDELVPVDDTPLVVLWQAAGGAGGGLKWLAYKELNVFDHALPHAFFSDDMESGASNWTSWNRWGLVTNRSHSPTTSWNNSPGGNYHRWEFAVLTSTSLDLSGVSSATLVFWHGHDFGNDNRDRGRVYIRTGGGGWTLLATYRRDLLTWTEERISIDAYLPSSDVRIGFLFTSDNDNRVGEGWYIDDVAIEGAHPDWDTLLVRMEETDATADPFNGQRVNDIRVYVGTTGGHDESNADGSPLDTKRYGNPRWNAHPALDEIHWPPDEVADWAPADDFFTLLQGWVLNGTEPSIALTGTVDEPDAILRMNTYTTPTSGTFTQEEIGLHTFGETSTDVYFDDFAIQLEVFGQTFLPPIQH